MPGALLAAIGFGALTYGMVEGADGRLRRALVGLRGLRRRARRLLRGRTARGRADAAARPLPAAQLRGREPGDVLRLRRALGRPRLLDALPPVPRLLPVRGGTPQHTHERDHDPARRPLRHALRPPRAAASTSRSGRRSSAWRCCSSCRSRTRSRLLDVGDRRARPLRRSGSAASSLPSPPPRSPRRPAATPGSRPA